MALPIPQPNISNIQFEGIIEGPVTETIGLPTSGHFGLNYGPNQNVSNLQSTQSVADAFSNVESIIDYTSPNPPGDITTVPAPNPSQGFYSAIPAIGSVAAVYNNVCTATGGYLSVDNFGYFGPDGPPGGNGNNPGDTLQLFVNNGTGYVSYGLITFTSALDSLTNQALYAQETKVSTLYTAISAQINTILCATPTPFIPNNNTSVVSRIQLTHTVVGFNPVSSMSSQFLVDSVLITPQTISVGASLQSIQRTSGFYASGVPALSTNDIINVQASFNGCVSNFINSVWLGRASGTEINTTLYAPNNLATNANPGVIMVCTVANDVYNSNSQIIVRGRNSIGDFEDYDFSANLYIDSTSSQPTTANGSFINEGNTGTIVRLKVGTPTIPPSSALYPTDADLYTFDPTESLGTANNEELQLQAGIYIYPPAVNYLGNNPQGPNYTSLVAGADGKRWVTYQYSGANAIINSSYLILTIANIGGTWDTSNPIQATNDFEMLLKLDGVNGTAWLNANSANDPSQSKIGTNGVGCLDLTLGSSTYSSRRCSFGSVYRSGNVLIRIGIPPGSNKNWTGVTIGL